MTPPADLHNGTASVGYWLRRRRQALDLTQARLAHQVGCATITIQKIEADERRPSRQMAGRLAEALAIPDDEHSTFIASVLGEVSIISQCIDTHPLLPSVKPSVGAPPTPKVDAIPTNLPHQLTPFVGRKTELAQLEELLQQQDTRLITITGPGGMGKTRLALALAERYLADMRFMHGVYFIALAPLTDAQHIVVELATALSFPLQFGDPTHSPQQLLEHLRGKAMLLLFDNFEHLLDGATLVTHLLHVAPKVQVLVTSREWLRLPGEHLLHIEGLAYGDADCHEHDNATATEAVQLFVQSARIHLPHLDLHKEDWAEVVRICHLVGGMPLGIELAAAWLPLLSLTEISAEIQRGLDFLAVERHGGRQEHQSIKAIFESSWRQLDQAHQRVLARLALFRSGFTRQAAEEVAGASLRMLRMLVSKSLIHYVRDNGRYTLHELLRQYAEEKLQSVLQNAEESYHRFCAYYTNLLHQQEALLTGPQQLIAIGTIETEIENIRMAWQWAVTHRQIEYIERGLNALSHFYATKSWYDEGVRMFGLAAQQLDIAAPTDRERMALARVLASQGTMLALVSYAIGGAAVRDEARLLCQRCLSIFDALGARHARVDPLYWLGTLALASGDIEQAIRLFEEALALALEQHKSWKTGMMLRGLASCFAATGEYAQAIHYHQRAASACSSTGDMRSLGTILYELADTLRAAGDYEDASTVAEKALAISQAVGAKRNTAHILRIRAELAWHQGDYATARDNAQASLAQLQELRLLRLQDASLVILGKVASGVGDHTQAKDYFHQVLRAHQQAGTLHTAQHVAHAAVGLADVLAKEGEREQAVEVLRLALHHPAVWHETKTQALQLLTRLTHHSIP